ncbi:MAG: 2OG-Fe(II) oxygenase [Candidatus Sericytochromatia bacterium]|nr:2OG-Fe(II) oxygenase [Candidatus Sericytochromatia bacterium]
MRRETYPLDFFTRQGLLFAQPEFLSSAEIQALHGQLADKKTEMAPIVNPYAQAKNRQGDRKTAQIEVSDQLRHLVSDRLIALRGSFETFFQVRLRGLEPPAFLKYLPGYYFKPHRDWLPEFAKYPGMSHLPPRQISTILLLSRQVEHPRKQDEYSGGELVFYLPTEAQGHTLIGRPLEPPSGTLIAFRSDLTHEVRAVNAGERISVVSWLF